MSSVPLSFPRLCLSLCVPLVVVGLSYRLKLQLELKLLIALGRCILQLFLAGYVLLGFIFASKSAFMILLYLLFMICIASVELTCRQVRTYEGHFKDSLACVCISGGLIGVFGSIVVFDPSPWYEPSVFVPTAGMLIGNSISGPALAVDRLLSEIMDKRHESEVRLAFGARSFEAVLPVVRSALSAALMPLINQMSVVGLVSIPGMMTGQLLGGSLPLVAAEAQMAILFLICGVTALSTYAATQLALNNAVFDASHRLTPLKITKRKEGKLELEVAVFRAVMALALKLIAFVSQQLAQPASTMGSGATVDAATVEGAPAGGGGAGTSMSNYEMVPPGDVDRSTHSMLHPPTGDVELASPQGKGPLFSSSSKAMFVVRDQTPEAYLMIEQPIPVDSFFNVENLNVLSGEIPLFPEPGWSFRLLRGQRIVISGPSGVGKTRLLRAISHLDEPLPLVRMNFGDSVFPETSIPEWRSRVIYVPQSIPPCAGSPVDLLKEALGYTSRSALLRARTLLENCDVECGNMEDSLGLEKGKLSAQWTSLSGGERQRCCIGIALLIGGTSDLGAVVLMDEPTAACDAESMIMVERAIISSGLTSILITHDERQAQRIAHKRIIISPHAHDTGSG